MYHLISSRGLAPQTAFAHVQIHKFGANPLSSSFAQIDNFAQIHKSSFDGASPDRLYGAGILRKHQSRSNTSKPTASPIKTSAKQPQISLVNCIHINQAPLFWLDVEAKLAAAVSVPLWCSPGAVSTTSSFVGTKPPSSAFV